MKHYVYRITNTKLNKHYYGTRTSKNRVPKEDIGYIYFSSSSDKDFIKDQKENPQDYKYKVIKKFKTRKEAIELEIKLHNKFNVGVNESFYNRSKQSSTGFDTTGNEVIAHKISNIRNDIGWKKTIGKNLTEKRLKTMRENGTFKISSIKYKETVNSKDWIETKGKEKKKKLSEIQLKRNPKYDILYSNRLIFKSGLYMKEITKLSQAYRNSSKDKPLGYSNHTKNRLIKSGKTELLDTYIIKYQPN